MTEERGYHAVIAPDGTVRVRPPGGIPVYPLTPDQIEVLWATFEEGSLHNRLDASTDEHKGQLWRGVNRLREAKLIAGGRSYAHLEFSDIGLEMAEFLFQEWPSWDLYKQRYIK